MTSTGAVSAAPAGAADPPRRERLGAAVRAALDQEAAVAAAASQNGAVSSVTAGRDAGRRAGLRSMRACHGLPPAKPPLDRENIRSPLAFCQYPRPKMAFTQSGCGKESEQLLSSPATWSSEGGAGCPAIASSSGPRRCPSPTGDWLAAAERLPIESVWQGGHVLPRHPTGEAITRLALMTAWTERVRVGTAVLLLPLYHPVARGQAGRRPRRLVGRAGLGRRGRRRRVPRRVRRRRRPPARARRPHRRGHAGPPGAVGRRARSPTTAASSTSTTSRCGRWRPPDAGAAPGSPAGRPCSSRAARRRPCGGPPASATAGCPT